MASQAPASDHASSSEHEHTTATAARNRLEEEAIIPSRNPDPAQFKEYICTRTPKKKTYHLIRPTASESTYTILIRNKAFQAQKPDIQLFANAEKSCPLVGVAKLHHKHAREFVIGVGDPDVFAESEPGKEIVWESLRRGEKWRHISHIFEFGDGKERGVYTWRRTVKYWSNCVRDMELRVGGRDEKDGELVARWTGTNWHNSKKGMLFVKSVGETELERRKWEAVVVLTSMAIIENAVRRSR